MPASSSPADDATESGSAAGLPTSVRVATIAMSLLAGLLLINAALTWFGRAAVARRIIEAGNHLTEAAAERSVVLSTIPFLVLGVLLAVSAWFLPRRQAWARWTGLASSGLLTMLTAFSVVSLGGITLASLLLLGLSIAAVTSLVSRTTSSWVPRLRAGR